MHNNIELNIEIDKNDFKKKLDIKDGRDGKDGVDGLNGIDGINGTDGSPDTAEQVRDKLETLKKEERLDIKAIKGVEKLTSEIENKTNANTERAISILDQRTQFLINKATTSLGNGSGTPGGSDTEVQFNDNGTFGGDSHFVWDKTDKRLFIGPDDPAFVIQPQVPLMVGLDENNYGGVTIQNLSDGDSASGDYIISADNDGAGLVGHYIDIGIEGSGFTPSTAGNINAIDVSTGTFDGGSGYTVGDTLTITTGNSDATFTVDTVDGSGKVLTVTLVLNGSGYSISVNNATVGGTGSGCYVDIISLLDFSGISANDGYAYVSGGNMIIGTDSGSAGKNLKIFLGGLATGNKIIEVSQSQGTSGVIPEVTVDPGDPFEQSAWMLKSGGDIIPNGTPIGLLLGLTYTDVTPVNTYQLSYFTKEGTIIRTTMS